MAKFDFFHIIILIAILLIVSEANKCVQDGPCMCKFDEYTQINLTQILPSDAKFIQDSEGNYKYFFSGCNDAKFIPKNYNLNINQSIEGSLIKCIEIKVPIKNETGVNVTHNCNAIGHSSQIKYELASGSMNDYQIVYNVKYGTSFPSIRLVCDTYTRTDLKIISNATDALTLYSPFVCVKHISHHGLSSGSIFCLIFFTAAFIYFVGGGLIMYTARGARGVEVIPNFEFWVSLPGLMRDGMIYLLSGCRPSTVTTAETYDRI